MAGSSNSHFTFGRFEKSAVHFHEQLAAHLALLKIQQANEGS
jgi:hypothetical protein